jgi:lysophospholipase L1-like esterase
MGEPVSAAVSRGVRRERARLLRGLLDPNPGARRLLAPPVVMTSPPTITLGTGAGGNEPTSQITTPTKTFWTDPRFRYYAGAAAQASLSANDVKYGKGQYINGTAGIGPFTVDFEIDCQAFEFFAKGNSSWYRLTIDGQPASASMTQMPTDGLYYGVKVDFGSKAIRRVELRCDNSFFFGGIWTGPGDTFWQSSAPLSKRVIVVGDSFGEGQGCTTGQKTIRGFIAQLGLLMGWTDIWMSGLGGTGYQNPNVGSGLVKYATRVQTDVVARAPALVIWTGGLNDNAYPTTPSFSAATELAEMLACYQAVQAIGVPQIVVGPFYNRGDPNANMILVRNQAQAAALALGLPFIDPIVATAAGTSLLGWITGTGHVGGTTGTGNADAYITTDSTHPTDAGHLYFARRIASGIAPLIAAGSL